MKLQNADTSEKSVGINWKQIAKTAGSGVKTVFTPIMPVTMGTISNTTAVARDLRNATRINLNATRQQSSAMRNSANNKKSQSLFKSALDDIRSGNFSMDSINDDLFEGYESETADSFDMPSGDDAVNMSSEEILLIGNKGVAQSVIQSSSAQLRGLEEASKTLVKSNIKTTQALAFSLNNTLQHGFNSINANLTLQNQKLDVLNANLQGIIEFNNTNALEYYSKSLALMDGLGKMMSNYEQVLNPEMRKKKKTFDTSRGFDIKEYVDHVMKGLQDSLFGTTASMAKGAVQGAGGGGIAEMIVDALIPKQVKDPLKKLDVTLNRAIDEGFKRLGERLNSGDLAFLGLGDIFGKPREQLKSLKLGDYMKDATPWNGVAQKALVEVIPELLTSIDSKLDGSDKRYFDYGTGQFKTKSKIQQEFKDEYFDTFSMMLSQSMDELTKAAQSTMRPQADQDSLIASIQALIDDNLSGTRDAMGTRREMRTKMQEFGISDTKTGEFLREFQEGIENAVSRINDLYHDVEKSQHIYRSINNQYGEEYTKTIRDMHRGDIRKRDANRYRSFSFMGGNSIDDYIRSIANLSLDAEIDDALIQKIRDGGKDLSDRERAKLVQAYFEQKKLGDKISGKAKSKVGFIQKVLNIRDRVSNSAGGRISSVTQPIEDLLFNILYMGETPWKKQKGATASTAEIKSLTAPEAPKAATSHATRSGGASITTSEQRDVDKVVDISTKDYDKTLNQSNSENDRDFKVVTDTMAKMTKDTSEATTVEESIIRSNNMLRVGLGAIVSSFKGFTSRLFGKEGFFKQMWDSEARKNLTGRLFTNDDAIFKKQYDAARAGLKKLKEDTKGYLGKGYDFVYDNTMQYMYGAKDKDGNDISYEESEDWKNNGLLSQTLNRKWRAAQKKSAVADIMPAEVKEATETVKEAVGDAADNVAKSAENLQESTDAFVGVVAGDPKQSPEQKKKLFSDQFLKKMKATLPKSLAGAAVGAGVGLLNNSFSLLGSAFLPGGPIGGAIVGGGLTILTQTEAFKSLMFGKLGEDGTTRSGGLLNDKMRESFKKALPMIIGGGAIGAVTGLLKSAVGFNSGLGVLGMQILPGGILGGAILGAGTALLRNSETFKKMLFGEKDENGQRSGKFLSNSFNKFTSGFTKIMPGLKKAGAGLGVGALTGAVLSNAGYIPAMFSLGGPVGMGIAGLGIGIAASTEKFNTWMFGTEELDENGNPTGKRRRDGLLARVTNMLMGNVVEPIGDAFKSKMADLVDWTKDKVTYPFRLAMGPILDSLTGIKDNVVDFVKDKFDALGNGIMRMMRTTISTLFSPITKAIGFVGKSVIGVASTAAKVAMSPISGGLQLLQLMTAGKRGKEYRDFYKSYYKKGNIMGTLNESWAAQEERDGKKVNIFQKMSDTVGAYLGQGEVADAARAGWNAIYRKEGKGHLLWREVGADRRKLHADRKERLANEKQWKKIDKYRNVIKKDLGYRDGIELTDYQLNEYRDNFKKLGISEDQLRTSSDIMDLLYKRDDFKKKLDPTGNGGGIVVEETPEQKAARERTEAYENTMEALLKGVADRMGVAAVDTLTKKKFKTSDEEWKKDIRDLEKNAKAANVSKLVDLSDPRLRDYNIRELDKDLLSGYRYSKYAKNKDLIGFMKEYKITRKSDPTWKEYDSTELIPEVEATIRTNSNSKNKSPVAEVAEVVKEIQNSVNDLLTVNKEQKEISSAELEVVTGGAIDDDTVRKKKGKSFGARFVSKFNAVTQLLGFKKRKAKKDAEAAESAQAQALGDEVEDDESSETTAVATKDDGANILKTIWNKIKSVGALIGGTTLGGFIFKAAKTMGAVGLLGGIGLTIAELVSPGTTKTVGASIDAFTKTIEEEGVGGIFGNLGDKISGWWNKTMTPWWDEKALPWLKNAGTTVRDAFVEGLPNAISSAGEILGKSADTLVAAGVSVIENVGVPLAGAIARATPEIIKGVWDVTKAFGTAIWEEITGKKKKEDVSDTQKQTYETSGTQVATEFVGSVEASTEAEAKKKAKEEFGLSNPVLTYNPTTGKYDISQNVVTGKNIARDSISGNTVNTGLLKDRTNENLARIGTKAALDASINLYGGKAIKGYTVGAKAVQVGADIAGKGLKAGGTLTKNTLGKIPGLLGVPGKLVGTTGEISGTLLQSAAHPINTAKNTATKLTGLKSTLTKKAASEVTEEVAENTTTIALKEGIEKGGKKVAKETIEVSQKSMLETLLKKMTKWLDGVVTNKTIMAAASTAAKQIGGEAGDTILNKLRVFLVDMVNKILLNSSKCMKELTEAALAAVAKVTGKAGLAAGTMGIAELVSIGVGGIFGAVDAPNLFQTKNPDWIMRIVSTLLEALLSSTIGSVVDFIFAACSIIGSFTDNPNNWDFKKMLAEFLYKLLCGFSEESIAKLEAGQAALKAEKDVYNALNQTNLSLTAYNDEANKTLFGKIATGTKKAVKSIGNVFGQNWGGTIVDTDSAEDIRKALNKAGVTDAQISDWAANDTNRLEEAIRRVQNGQNVHGGTGAGFGPAYGAAARINGIYAQGNPKWGKMPIGLLPDGTVATMERAGCGPTALAAAANTVAERGIGYGKITPADMGAYAASNGYISEGGANPGLFTEGAERLGLKSNPVANSKELRQRLMAGQPAVLSGKSSSASDPYTSAGHIVLADGINGNKMSVLDPISGKRKLYDINNVSRNTNYAWAYSSGYGPSMLVSNAQFDGGDTYYSTPKVVSNSVADSARAKLATSLPTTKTSQTAKSLGLVDDMIGARVNDGLIDGAVKVGYHTDASGIDTKLMNYNYEYFMAAGGDTYYRKKHATAVKTLVNQYLTLDGRNNTKVTHRGLAFVLSTQYFGLTGGTYGSVTIKKQTTANGNYKPIKGNMTKSKVAEIYAAAIISENAKGNRNITVPLSPAEKRLAFCNACRVMFGIEETMEFMTSYSNFNSLINGVKDEDYRAILEPNKTITPEVAQEVAVALEETGGSTIIDAEKLRELASGKNFLGKLALVANIAQAKFNTLMKGSDFWVELSDLIGETNSSSNSTTTTTSGGTAVGTSETGKTQIGGNGKISLTGTSSALAQYLRNPKNIQEELLAKTIESIYHSESRGKYSVVINDSDSLASVGPYQAHAGNAVDLLKNLAIATGVPNDLRKTFSNYASIISKGNPLTDAQKKELSEALANAEHADSIKKSIDNTAMKYYTTQYYRPYFAKYYDNGTIKDLRTLPMLADIANAGIGYIVGHPTHPELDFIHNWTPVSADRDFEEAYKLLTNPKLFYSKSEWSAGYLKHIQTAYDNMKNYKFKNSVKAGQLGYYFNKGTNPLGYGKLEDFTSAMSGIGDAMNAKLSNIFGIEESGSTSANTSTASGANYKISDGQLTSLSGTDKGRFIAAARSQVGYLEKKNKSNLRGFTNNPGSNSYTKYAQEIAGWNGPGADWCNYFTSWAGKAAGIPTEILHRDGSCTSTMKYYKGKGLYKSSSSYKGNSGDLAFFNWSKDKTRANHIGVVTKSDGKNIYTIEGNTSNGSGYDAAAEKTRSFDSGTIIGFATPKWTNQYGTVNPQTFLSLGYGDPRSDRKKIDGIAMQESLRKSIDEMEDFKVSPNDFKALGFGPGMKVDAGFDMSRTDDRLDKIFGLIAEWYSEAKDSEKKTAGNVNVVSAKTTNVNTPPQSSAPANVQTHKDKLVNHHMLLAAKKNIRNTY